MTTAKRSTRAPSKSASRPAKQKAAKNPPPRTATSRAKNATPDDLQDTTIAGVALSSPDRVMYPEQEVTKRQIAEYYESIAEWVLPHVVDRPLSLVRCPQGRTKQCFYQKHWTDTLPPAIDRVKVREKSGTDWYTMIHDLAGLVSLVQVSVLEIHPWGARSDKLEQPDRIVIDLDPGPDVLWSAVARGAEDVRSVLSELKLTSFVRASGGKGLHVVVPIARRNTWDDVSEFAHHIALGLARTAGDRYVANMRKDLRRGKVYVDYLRNQRGSTAVASYSTRSRAGATVAMPVEWKEIARLGSADTFNIQNAVAHIRNRKSDPWEGMGNLKQTLSRHTLAAAADFAGVH